MADAGGAAGGPPAKSERPLGPDGKPIPGNNKKEIKPYKNASKNYFAGPEDMRKIQAQRKMGQQQAQVDEVIGIMHKNVEAV